MDLQLTGKRALVTGSTSGIGEAIARTLAAEGVAVVVHGRRETEAARVVDAIRGAGGYAAAALGDLADARIADAVVQATREALGDIDILVNNAGIYPYKPWFDIEDGEWLDLYNQNVGSAVRMIHAFVPAMKARGWGRVITIADGVATMPLPFVGPYAASKSALLSIAINVAKELRGSGVTSNAVSPGAIYTPGTATMFRELAVAQGVPDEWSQIEHFIVEHVAPTPVGRLGLPQDLAAMVAFLASPRAGFVNSANIRVDGGAVGTV